jgi:GTP cyclohydrolase FolE2
VGVVGPDLAGPEIDPPAAVDRVGFEDLRELVEIDRQRRSIGVAPAPGRVAS